MLRSGFILGVSAPAAILTLMVHPMVRDAADRWIAPVAHAAPASMPASLPLPGMRPASLAISPTRVAGVPRVESRSTPVATQGMEPAERPALRQPRRIVREGCETALSALVGPEARRMTPGRCIS
ncbi:hypothetical protein [Methylobacterium dankookense]|uniref:Uncharacterized protein n=1 Tax=Methylobacterium dankookense TaxID=560405 RepID=A0A564G2B1_9HYPH|nr:hypothetical protein [Methylobacterium dankookense]GJD58017.1 hypothetical protein IFDJLNFL_3931 [Methylobacterium dankookense]VUF14633.1 hypothetical protein MTDSW087_04358 [Methylobacterium dankookense]